jgi:hypothetical protein
MKGLYNQTFHLDGIKKDLVMILYSSRHIDWDFMWMNRSVLYFVLYCIVFEFHRSFLVLNTHINTKQQTLHMQCSHYTDLSTDSQDMNQHSNIYIYKQTK